MLEGAVSNIEKTIIYVRLTNEPILVWRPVLATRLSGQIYSIDPQDIDTDIEVWEFVPGDAVRVEKQKKSGGAVLVAIEKLEK